MSPYSALGSELERAAVGDIVHYVYISSWSVYTLKTQLQPIPWLLLKIRQVTFAQWFITYNLFLSRKLNKC